MLVAALSTEAFVNVYVKCQDVVTAKPRYVSRGAVVGKIGNTSVLPRFYGIHRIRRRQWRYARNVAATKVVLPAKNLPWLPWLVHLTVRRKVNGFPASSNISKAAVPSTLLFCFFLAFGPLYRSSVLSWSSS